MTRTPTDFALEHAEYMAKDAERLLDAVTENAAALMALEEDGTDPDGTADYAKLVDRCEQAESALGEHMAHMRSGIHEFRKRRDRALATPAPAQPEDWKRPHPPSRQCMCPSCIPSFDERFEAGAAAPAEGAAWQPIETAPKDCTEILAWVKEVGGAMVLMYFSSLKRWEDGITNDSWTPTHWAPLPAAPKEKP